MKKTVEYVVRTTVNPITQETQTLPVVVNRREPVDLVDVVANCIDRNLILGAKPTAAQGIAEGIAEQLAVEFRKGNGVKFGKYFYGRLYLDGTTNQNGDLTDENAVNVRLYKGEDFKLTLDDFAFSFVNGGDLPDVEFCVGRGDGVKGELVAGNDLVLNGTNLYYDDDIAVTVKLTSEDGVVRTVSGDAITSKSADLLVVPAAAIPPLELANGKWKVSVERQTADGKKLYGRGANVQCVGFGPTPGPEPLAQTSDGKCKIMSMDDEGSTTNFLYGSAWNVNGTGIYGDRAAPGGEWEIARCSVSVDGSDYTLAGNFNEEGTHGEISPLGGDTPARGTYHDIELSLVASRGTESETLTITLPTFIVE